MRMRTIGIVLTVLLVLVSACASPQGNSLTYKGVTEVTVKAGEFVPGTGIRFLGEGEQGARVSIDGKEVTRLVGDSLKWQGEVMPGVTLSVNLRVLHISADKLITSGVVSIHLDGVQPQAAAVDKDRPVRYTLPVTYKVNKGERIPGTSIRFVGNTEGKGATFEGLEGYPYRSIGDSLLWDGRLLSNVDLHLNVRVGYYNDSFLQVLGTATVGMTPESK